MSALELDWRTPRAWAERALDDPLALLSDHAHCELGAAAASQGLITRRPENAKLVDRLSALAAEEMRHFRRVHRLLIRRGGRLEAPRRNDYVEGLLRKIDRVPDAGSDSPPDPLLDRLLIAALIEKRSHERFELLAEVAEERGAADPGFAELGRLYTELGPSEAGHATLFVELAEEACGERAVALRLALWVARESDLARSLPFSRRIHGGPPHPQPA